MELFRKSAGYRYMDAFILANVIELATRQFCLRFLNLRNDPGGRTFAQMTHAGRSGARNFAEGSERLMTSFASAMELLDVARASLCELRDDFNAWLLLRGEAPWPMESDTSQRVFGIRLDKPDYGSDVNRGVCLHILAQYRKFGPELDSDDSLVRANTLLILISRTVNMMEKYIKTLGDEFAKGGGFRERLSTVRSETRARPGDGPGEAPACPQCGAPMRLRKTRKDNRGFWGCTQYPACRGILDCPEDRTKDR
ncbi:MAG: four helix bundle suffix domain-containing protein [Lentisphaeria bacterium]|nr:four helix bundle suffix domain-containing protein [Lentisphaeria bacterium]